MAEPTDRPSLPEDDVDPVIEACKRGIDRTLLRENLKLTVEERFRRHQELLDFTEELRRPGKQMQRGND